MKLTDLLQPHVWPQRRHSVSLDQHVALRQELDGLEGGSVGTDQALTALNEPIGENIYRQKDRKTFKNRLIIVKNCRKLASNCQNFCQNEPKIDQTLSKNKF